MRMIKKALTVALSLALIAVNLVISSYHPNRVISFAESLSCDNTTIQQDLSGAVIDGKDFNEQNFPFDSSKQVDVLALSEYCYSYRANEQANFALYVYVYNPSGARIDILSSRNKISLRFGSQTSFAKYTLDFIDEYHNLYYKFKVNLSDKQKTSILNKLASSDRVYELAGIELSVGGELHDRKVADKYHYSGYADGYGTGEKLNCKKESFETISIDVKSTYYRPEECKNEAQTLKDSLYSVYFNVPKSVTNKHGDLVAVHATWLEAETQPIFVTGNESVYNDLKDYVGVDIAEAATLPSYYFITKPRTSLTSQAPKKVSYYYSNYNINAFGKRGIKNDLNKFEISGSNYESVKTLWNLPFVVPTDSFGLNAADNFYLSSDKLKAYMTERSEGKSDLVCEKYSKELFSRIDAEYTDIVIRADDQYSLERITFDNFFKKLFGSETVLPSYSMPAIQHVSNASSASQVERDYYINHNDFSELVRSMDSNSDTYVFHFAQSEYYAEECWELKKSGSDPAFQTYKYVDNNAYLCKETAYLDFDVIDLTFYDGEQEVVLAVVSSPIDVIGGTEPPADTTEEIDWKKTGNDFLSIFRSLLAGVVLFFVVYGGVKLFVAIRPLSRKSRRKKKK